jgi:hypothetical protein
MSIRYDENTKARAVRLVRDQRDDYDSEWAPVPPHLGRIQPLTSMRRPVNLVTPPARSRTSKREALQPPDHYNECEDTQAGDQAGHDCGYRVRHGSDLRR